ncbi:hypothetical protein ACFV4N_26055 [Actinosynnema sp. NPDC059797]
MTATTMTRLPGRTTPTPTPTAPATPSAITTATAATTTAVRFVGHFAAALLGVAFLGRDLEH